ncbi:replication-relaxation family protein [bacterium]|nr:replication-relaxation family protein [bacterium]
MNTRKKKRRSRYVRDKKNPPRMKITERDVQIVNTISDFRFATVKQVALMIHAHAQTTRIRMYLLWQNKFLDRLDLPVFVGNGSPPAVYVVGSQGKRLLTEQLGIDPSTIVKVDSKRNYFFLLNHTLRRNDFRAVLYAACRERDDLEFLFWKQDKEVGNSVTIEDGRSGHVRVPLVPDGFVGINTPQGRMQAFVEIDRGTIGHKKFLLKQRGYFKWWQEGRYIEKYGERNFRILIVTTNPRRMANLIKTTMRVKETNQGSGFFWFTTFDHIIPENPAKILEPIWIQATTSNSNLWPLI